jgi:diacylglycerol kinase (ATP)
MSDDRNPVPAPAAPRDGSQLKGRRGFRRVIAATRYSLEGVVAAWHHENAFRQEVMLAAVLTPIAFLLPLPAAEKVLLIGSLLVVLIAELLNTAIEAAVDRDSFEINPLGKRAKDYGSAAVMMALLLAVLSWVTILGAHYL